MQLCVTQQFAGQTVLLTGGLGFLGSVILEQLLRLTEVQKVYLLCRPKRHLCAAQRVEKLLCSSLFNTLHSSIAAGGPNVFTKVEAVEGDVCLPGLGLSPADTQMIKDEVNIVIHCAASLELDAQIQKTLRANYYGTAELLQLASEMPHLRAFVFTSTYFTNNYLPRNSVVREHLHCLPLTLGGRTLNHEKFVQAVLAMAPEEADRQVAALMASLNFTSTYAFGKLLTEHLVSEAALRGVSKVIVRPSLISAIAGDPYPGFINNYAGAPGFMMGYAAGFFHSISSMAYASDYLLDLIPCDTVAALVIAAAAAAAAEAGPSAPADAKIYHAASAHSHPLTVGYAVQEAAKFWTVNPPPMRLPFSRYFTYDSKHDPTEWGVTLGRWITQAKVWVIIKLLEWSGKDRQAKALANGFKALCVQNSFRYNRSIVSAVDNARKLRDSMLPAERTKWQVVWDSSASSWDAYGYTFLAGVRRLLFRVPGEVTVDKPCNFVFKDDAPAHVCELILTALSNTSSRACSRASSSSGSSDDLLGQQDVAGTGGELSSGLTTAVSVGDGKSAMLRAVGKQVVELSVKAAAVGVVH